MHDHKKAVTEALVKGFADQQWLENSRRVTAVDHEVQSAFRAPNRDSPEPATNREEWGRSLSLQTQPQIKPDAPPK